MRCVRIVTLFTLLGACASSSDQGASANTSTTPSTASTSSAPGEGMPAPVDVCVEENGMLTAATVEASRAGTYDPAMPIDETLLNWFVSGSYCVTYPGHSQRRARCGHRAAETPVVTRTLCQQ